MKEIKVRRAVEDLLINGNSKVLSLPKYELLLNGKALDMDEYSAYVNDLLVKGYDIVKIPAKCLCAKLDKFCIIEQKYFDKVIDVIYDGKGKPLDDDSKKYLESLGLGRRTRRYI